jgi:hypothetical protein
MKAERGSHISLTCVDQDVLLTKRGNDLSRTRVLNELLLYDNAGDFDVERENTQFYVNMMKPGVVVLTDGIHFGAHRNRSNRDDVTRVRRNSNFDFSSDVLNELIIPMMPTCKHSEMDALEKQELEDRSVLRSNLADTFLWTDVNMG